MKHPIITIGAVGVTAFVLGIAASPSTAEPETVTETVTVTAEPEEVQVEVTPQACLDALDDADTALVMAGDGFSVVADAFGASADLDVYALEVALGELESMTPLMEAAMDTYVASSTQCRAGGASA